MATRKRLIDKLEVITEFIPPAGWEGGGGGAVDSVNGQTGVVVLNPDDLDDAATTHKFTSVAEITDLYTLTAQALQRAITVTFGDGVADLVADAIVYLSVYRAITISGWTIVADAAGSIVVDVWKDTYANAPPTVADSIAGANKPTLSGVQKNQATGLSWAVAAGSVMAFKIDSATTVKRVSITFAAYQTS